MTLYSRDSVCKSPWRSCSNSRDGADRAGPNVSLVAAVPAQKRTDTEQIRIKHYPFSAQRM